MKKGKVISAVIVLLGALISCICSIVAKVAFGVFIKRLAITVLIFLVLAFIIEIIIEWNFPDMEEETDGVVPEGEEDGEERLENVETQAQGERITDSEPR